MHTWANGDIYVVNFNITGEQKITNYDFFFTYNLWKCGEIVAAVIHQ